MKNTNNPPLLTGDYSYNAIEKKLLEQQLCHLVEATAPSKELMSGTFGDISVGVEASRLEVIHR